MDFRIVFLLFLNVFCLSTIIAGISLIGNKEDQLEEARNKNIALQNENVALQRGLEEWKQNYIDALSMGLGYKESCIEWRHRYEELKNKE